MSMSEIFFKENNLFVVTESLLQAESSATCQESCQNDVQRTMVFLLSTNVETIFPFGDFLTAADKRFLYSCRTLIFAL